MAHHGIYIYGYDENGRRIEQELPFKEESAQEWDEYKLFTVEPELAAISIAAATTRFLSVEIRSIMFSVCMKEADKLVGEEAKDPRLRSKAAWDFFSDYMFDLLGL